MAGSTQDNYATALEPSGYAMHQVVLLAVEQGGLSETEDHAALATHPLPHSTATHAVDSVVRRLAQLAIGPDLLSSRKSLARRLFFEDSALLRLALIPDIFREATQLAARTL